MSIDKVASLPTSSVDLAGARAGGVPRAAAIALATQEIANTTAFGSVSAPRAAPARGPTVSYDGLSLPLPAAALLGGAASRGSALDLRPSILAAYGLREGAEMPLIRLVGQRLPPQAVIREAVAALREGAAEKGASLTRYLQSIERVATDDLPSRNGEDATYALRGSLAAEAENGEPRVYDLYLTRVDARHWEAAVFNRQDAAPPGGFPYAAPPISVDRLTIDPTSGQVLASVACHIPVARRAPQHLAITGDSLLRFLLVGIVALAATVISVVLMSHGAGALGVLVLVASGALVYKFSVAP
jgi:hypothetical protein